MQKSLRSFALIAVLAFAVVPAMHANQTGCNPTPSQAYPPKGNLMIYVNVLLSLIGA